MLWRKSSFSGGDANCVEVAWPGAGAAIRDSKNPEARIDAPVRAFARLLVIVKER